MSNTVNNRELKVKDSTGYVKIISGPYKGTVAKVISITEWDRYGTRGERYISNLYLLTYDIKKNNPTKYFTYNIIDDVEFISESEYNNQPVIYKYDRSIPRTHTKPDKVNDIIDMFDDNVAVGDVVMIPNNSSIKFGVVDDIKWIRHRIKWDSPKTEFILMAYITYINDNGVKKTKKLTEKNFVKISEELYERSILYKMKYL